MSHHSGYPMDQNSEDYQKLLNDLGLIKTPPHPLGLGATGKFPAGKLNHNDEGGIMIGVTSKDGRVVIDFGKQVTWVGFTPEEAMQLAAIIVKRATEAMDPNTQAKV